MVLSFICRVISVEQILKCSFGLNKTELYILKSLLETKEEKTIKEIREIVKKDRTTVQRAIKHLHEKDLIARRQINLEKGGYVLIYSARSKKELKEKVFSIVESFKEMVGSEIQRW